MKWGVWSVMFSFGLSFSFKTLLLPSQRHCCFPTLMCPLLADWLVFNLCCFLDLCFQLSIIYNSKGRLSVASLVEILQKVTLTLKFDLFVIGEATVSLHGASAHRRDHVENHAPPNVPILNIVQSFRTGLHKLVHVVHTTTHGVLAPV